MDDATKSLIADARKRASELRNEGQPGTAGLIERLVGTVYDLSIELAGANGWIEGAKQEREWAKEAKRDE